MHCLSRVHYLCNIGQTDRQQFRINHLIALSAALLIDRRRSNRLHQSWATQALTGELISAVVLIECAPEVLAPSKEQCAVLWATKLAAF